VAADVVADVVEMIQVEMRALMKNQSHMYL
jgi:hypothetical protein